MRELSAARCRNHPDRPGAALCMSCRAVACQECATRYDGVHYCARCLAARLQPAARRSAPVWIAWLLACAALLAALPWAVALAVSIVASYGWS